MKPEWGSRNLFVKFTNAQYDFVFDFVGHEITNVTNGNKVNVTQPRFNTLFYVLLELKFKEKLTGKKYRVKYSWLKRRMKIALEKDRSVRNTIQANYGRLKPDVVKAGLVDFLVFQADMLRLGTAYSVISMEMDE